MADAEADAEAVRAAATEVLLLDHDGHKNEALARARDLMLAHQDLAVTHRLLGELHYAAAVRAARGGQERRGGAAPPRRPRRARRGATPRPRLRRNRGRALRRLRGLPDVQGDRGRVPPRAGHMETGQE